MKYSDAGVDIRKGYDLVQRIKGAAAESDECVGTVGNDDVRGGKVLSSLGGFGSLYQLGDYRRPVLVSGTDGVGTKLHLAVLAQEFEGIGIDCVAMCVNDILCHGAEPLFFLDYLAYADLPAEQLVEVVEGVVEGCRQSGCALVGGETAQMPGTYKSGDFDIAGFALGAVEYDAIVDGSKIAAGDVLVGLSSSGLHSNGFSLVRALLSEQGIDPYMDFEGRPLIKELLTPTRIYVKTVLPMVKQGLIHGMAHITGGGLYENVPRMFQAGLGASIKRGSWKVPTIFSFIEGLGVDHEEMLHTFNMGIGFVVAVAPEKQTEVLRNVEAAGVGAQIIGEVVQQEGACFE